MARGTGKIAASGLFRSNEEYLKEYIHQLRLLCDERLQNECDAEGTGPHEKRKSAGTSATLEELRARADASIARNNAELPLRDLARTHGLSALEETALAAVVAHSVNEPFEKALNRLGNSGRLAVRSLRKLLSSDDSEYFSSRSLFTPGSRLVSAGLLQVFVGSEATEEDFLYSKVEVPFHVSCQILGSPSAEVVATEEESITRPSLRLNDLVLSESILNELRILTADARQTREVLSEWGCEDLLRQAGCTIAVFQGPQGTGKASAAEAVASAMGMNFLPAEPLKIRSARSETASRFAESIQLARLHNAVLLFKQADWLFCTEFGDEDAAIALSRLLRQHEGLVIFSVQGELDMSGQLGQLVTQVVHFPSPDKDDRRKLWKKYLPEGVPLDPVLSLDELAREHEWTGLEIRGAIRLAVKRAASRTPDQRVIMADDFVFLEGSRTGRTDRHQKKLVDKITPMVKLEDVVLPRELAGQVGEIVQAVKNRAQVMERWGFGNHLRTGHSISALFHGPSGTGKTLTAEALAGELGLLLRIVRIPEVMDMYVGETDKNIARIFSECSDSEEVLLLDEADGLFSARVPGGMHNSYYINNHINSLLSEMDTFRGIVILSSNRPFTLDRAFDRRIRWKLRFPLPDIAAREQIWRKSVPPDAPVDPCVNYSSLAQMFDFAGGTIRNVVLKAAYSAAADASVITMQSLLDAAKSEIHIRKVRGTIGFSKARIAE
jgi:SpoVK/Ycf46/Vps4 family AAA+-type ATPase